jgi:hypothetical protein
VTVVMAVVLGRLLPPEGERLGISYAGLLRTALYLPLTVLAAHRVDPSAAGLFGALGFATFSVFWTTGRSFWPGAPYHYGDLTIGLFGLVGAGMALCANLAERWVDRMSTKAAALAFAICLAVSFVPLW